MNVYSLAKHLTDEEKNQLKKEFSFIKWGNVSQDVQTQLKINWIELELHQKMVEDNDTQLLDLLLEQNKKQDIEVIVLRFHSISLIQHDNVIKYLLSLTKKLSKRKVKLWIYPKEDQPYKLFLSLFQKIKNSQVLLVFNPAYLQLNIASIVSNFKVFKKYIGCVVAHDITKQKDPELIGYGQASLIALFKYMIKNHYRDALMLDPEYFLYLETLKKKQQGVFKFMRQKDIQTYQTLKERLKIDEKKDVQFIDIYHNQYEVLSIIFNLR
jgi:hypothetical protein